MDIIIEYLREDERCIGYLGKKCSNKATIGQPKFACESCLKKWDKLNKQFDLQRENKDYFISGEEEMTIYECFYRQKEVTSKDCQKCFKKMKDKYKTRAACVVDNAEKKEGSIF